MLQDADVTNTMDGKSDHRCLYTNITVLGHVRKKNQQTRQQHPRQPALNSPEVTRLYHEKLTNGLASGHKQVDDFTKLVVEAASHAQTASKVHEDTSSRHSEKITDLFERRRAAEDARERSDLSKQIWARLREERLEKNGRKLDQILEQAKGSREIAKLMRGSVKGRHINAMHDVSGDLRRDPQDIAESFADFYEDLYNNALGKMEASPAAGTNCPKVSREELKTALLKLRPGKACADDGLIAEMLKTDHERLLDAISVLFTEILHGLAPVLASWWFSRLTILFKKGDSKASKTPGLLPLSLCSVIVSAAYCNAGSNHCWIPCKNLSRLGFDQTMVVMT